MNVQSQEPPDGDFVAYLEAIERRQLAALRVQHMLPAPGAVAQPDAPDADRPAARQAEADALRERQTGTPGAAAAALPAGIVVVLIIGAVLVLSGLFGDGGPFLFIIGVALLIHAIRRLLRFRRGVPDRTRQQALQRVAALIDAARKR